MNLDFLLNQLAGEFPDKVKPRKLGNVFYYHQGFTDVSKNAESKGVYLPTDFVSQIVGLLRSAEPITDAEGAVSSYRLPNSQLENPHFLNPAVLKNVEQIINNIMRLALYSPSVDYGNSWITGDVGQKTKKRIDGVEKQVLVIPQGIMRAEVNATNFDGCNMVHPLANNAREMLSIMAKTMFHSGFETPYFRGRGVADSGNDAMLNDAVLSSSFIGVTWDFFGKPSYALAPKEKWLVASPQALDGHPLLQFKVAGPYQRRLYDRQVLLQQERSKAFGRQVAEQYYRNEASKFGLDVCYFLPNGILADAMCQNVGFIKGNKLIFVDGSCSSDSQADNYFFVGKTQKTVYNLIKLLDLDEITVDVVHNPREFSKAVTNSTSAIDLYTQRKSSDFVYNNLKEIDGMVVLGTFRGMEMVKGILPDRFYSSNNAPIIFPWGERAINTFEKIQSALWNTVYGINGGTRLTADQRYCTMFDCADLEKGIVNPLNLNGKTIEDFR